jgi:pectate lyase
MSTKLISLFALCVLLGLVLLACGGAADNANTAANANAAAGNANTKAAANTNTTTASTGDKIGVPECDEYITKVEACLAKAPAAAQASIKSSMDTMRTAWRTAAANPQGKAALATGCKTALEQAKTQYSAYGCSW